MAKRKQIFYAQERSATWDVFFLILRVHPSGDGLRLLSSNFKYLVRCKWPAGISKRSQIEMRSLFRFPSVRRLKNENPSTSSYSTEMAPSQGNLVRPFTPDILAQIIAGS